MNAGTTPDNLLQPRETTSNHELRQQDATTRRARPAQGISDRNPRHQYRPSPCRNPASGGENARLPALPAASGHQPRRLPDRRGRFVSQGIEAESPAPRRRETDPRGARIRPRRRLPHALPARRNPGPHRELPQRIARPAPEPFRTERSRTPQPGIHRRNRQTRPRIAFLRPRAARRRLHRPVGVSRHGGHSVRQVHHGRLA